MRFPDCSPNNYELFTETNLIYKTQSGNILNKFLMEFSPSHLLVLNEYFNDKKIHKVLIDRNYTLVNF